MFVSEAHNGIPLGPSKSNPCNLALWVALAVMPSLGACEEDGETTLLAPDSAPSDPQGDAGPIGGGDPDGERPDAAAEGDAAEEDAASGDAALADVGPLAIVGEWRDEYETAHEITNESWSMTMGGDISRFGIVAYDNDDGLIIARNDDGNTYSPGLWSRFHWTSIDDGLWYCQIRFDAPSQAEAEGSAGAVEAEPAVTGCNGFPWTRLLPAGE